MFVSDFIRSELSGMSETSAVKQIKMVPAVICILLSINVTLVMSNFEDEISAITEEVTRNYFRDFGCLVYVTSNGMETPSKPIDNGLVVTVNLNSTNSDILVDVYNLGCRGFVVRVQDRLQVVAELIKAYKKSSHGRYNNKRYLFLPQDKNDEDAAFLEGKNMFYMPDLAFVAVTRNASEYNILSHNFFDGYKYDVMKEKYGVLDVWDPRTGFRWNGTLYWDRLANLHGKRMIFALLQYIPFTLIKDGEYDGLETRIAAIYAKRKNATWSGKDHPHYLWGEIFENGSSNGILGSIYEHEADIGFAAIYQWHCDVMDCTYPYVHAEVTCLAPKPLPISAVYTIVLPFQHNVWVAVLVSYVFCSLFVFLLMKNERKNKAKAELLYAFFSTYRLHVEQTPRGTSARTSLATFLKIWTLYCFFICSIWRGGIVSYLTVPRFEAPINTAEDLVARWPEIEWGGSHIDWTKSIAQTTEPVMMTIVKKFRVLTDEQLSRRVKERNFGHFMERLPNGHYGFNEYINEEAMKELRIMENYFYTANCVMILPKGSPYLESLDKLLMWMFDTGLVQKLEMQTILEKLDIRLQTTIRSSTEKQRTRDVAIRIYHLEGVIFVYLIGIFVSCIAFLYEILSHYAECGEVRFRD